MRVFDEKSDLTPEMFKPMNPLTPGRPLFTVRYAHQLEAKRFALRRKLGSGWMFMGERQREGGDIKNGRAREAKLWGSFDRAKLWMTEGRAQRAIPARSKGIEIVEVTCLVTEMMTVGKEDHGLKAAAGK